MRRAISIPLTVKFRLGLDDCRQQLPRARARSARPNGVAAVAMHARTARQMFGGEADWSHIARLKETLSIPVIGNGDVRDAARTPCACCAETGCDGVMIGRGATKNPWIFRQIAALLSGGAVTEPTLADRRDLILAALPDGGRARALAASRSTSCASSPAGTPTACPTAGSCARRINQLPDVARFLPAVEDFFDELMLEQAA